ncbi:MAG TPA: CsiV family protein [Gammaproteobacteria bacterium]|nr:CsiV family protein [Gammaproteobacteria bacterium]
MKTTTALVATLLLASAFLAVSATPPAPAAQAPAPNWYDVEVIVFRSLDPAAGSNESWPADPGSPDWNGAVTLGPPDSLAAPIPYQQLSPVGEQLDDEWTRLKRSHDYQPLLHVTWVQPALDRASASAVRIGVPPSAVPAASSHATMPTPAPAIVTGTAPLQATLAYGDAKLSTTGPYLHFDLDLVLQGPVARSLWPSTAINTTLMAPPTTTAPAALPAAPPFQLYRLRQDRRVDVGKISYFDQPLFGAIVLVTPVRKP